MSDRLLSIRDVIAATGLSRAMLRLHRRGETRTPFPDPVATFGQSPAWSEADVVAWMAQPRPVGKPRITPPPDS